MGKHINKNTQNRLLFLIVCYLEPSKLETSISGLILKHDVQLMWNHACSLRPQDCIGRAAVEIMSGQIESSRCRGSKKRALCSPLFSGFWTHRQTNKQTPATFRRIGKPSKGLYGVPTGVGLSIERYCVKGASVSSHGKEGTLKELYCLFIT